MFGLLDLRSCNLPQNIRSNHACGVCNALACKFGRASRIMLNNDSVYLSLLTASQRTEVRHDDFTQVLGCKRWSNISVPCPDFQYPAAISVVLRGAKLLDDCYDESSFRSKILLAFHEVSIRKAENEIGDVGLPPLDVLVRQQHKREQDRGRELEYYSQTTEEVYSKVLSHTAELADAPTNSDALAKVGLHLGRIAYLLDSCADFPKDINAGRFNLLKALSPKAPASLTTNPKRLVTYHSGRSLRVIREAIRNVKLWRYREAITQVVTNRLNAKVERILMGFGRPVSGQVAFSMAPLAILTTMKFFSPLSDGGGDYCLSAAGTHAAEGAVGACIGGVGGSWLAGKIGAAQSTSMTQREQPVDSSPPPERRIGAKRDLFPAFQRYKAHSLMEDSPVEDERRRRGLTFLEQEQEITKERPGFMRRFDRKIRWYQPGGEGRASYSEWALTREEYSNLPEDEKRQYREWRRRLDACKRNNMRFSPYPHTDLRLPDGRYDRKEFSSTTGRRG